jgi:outer membrane protein
MSRVALAAVVGLSLWGLVGTQASAQGAKLAFVRGQDVLAQTPGRSEAEAQFNKEVDAARAQEKLWGDSINVMLADYGKTEQTLSADARQVRQQAIREKQASFQQRQQQLEQQVQQRQAELVQPILQRVNAVIDQVRSENGYAMVFDAQAGGGGLVAADKSLDITDLVIARLKTTAASAPAPSTTRPASGPTSSPSGVSRPKNPS